MNEIDIPEILYPECGFLGEERDSNPVVYDFGCIYCYRYDICLECFKKEKFNHGNVN